MIEISANNRYQSHFNFNFNPEQRGRFHMISSLD